MPVVNGVHQNKMTTVFEVPQGLDAIKETVSKARKVRISTVPPKLLFELLPFLKDKEDTKVLLSPGEKITDEMKQLGDVGVSKSKLYADYKGEEVLMGSITSPAVSFTILWKEDRIFEISAMNYERCVRCLGEYFDDMSWRFADKLIERPKVEEKTKPEPKPEQKPEVKVETRDVKPEVKPETRPEAKTEVTPESTHAQAERKEVQG